MTLPGGPGTEFTAKVMWDGKVAKKSRHFQTDEDYVWIDWFPIVMGTVGYIVPAFGTSRPGDTEGVWGYTCNTVSTETDEDDQSLLVVTWKRPKRLDTNVLLSEVKRIPGFGLTGKNYGTRVFLTPDIGAAQRVATLLPKYSTWPEEEDIQFPRVLVDAELEEHWRVGLARVVAKYRTLSQDEWLEANVGKGLLYGLVGGEEAVLRYDYTTPTALIIEGEEWDTKNKKRYVYSLYQGSNIVPVGTQEFIVRVVLRAPVADEPSLLVGRYNGVACPNISNSPATALRFKGLNAVPIWGTDGLHMCEFHLEFRWMPDENGIRHGWDKFCTVLKKTFMLKSVKSKDEDGTVVTAPLTQIEMPVPDGSPEVQDRITSLSDQGLPFRMSHINAFLDY